jgi:hypothetical protein
VEFNAKADGRWSARVKYARELSSGEQWPRRWLVYAIGFIMGPLR